MLPNRYNKTTVTLIMLCALCAVVVINYLFSTEDENVIRLNVPALATLCPKFQLNSGFAERINFIDASGQYCPLPHSVCAVESASRLNPSMKIGLFIHSNTGQNDRLNLDNCRIADSLKLLTNVEIKRQDLYDFLNQTDLNSVEFTPKETPLFKGLDAAFVDVLKMAVLKEFGGVYMDLNFMAIRPVHCLINTIMLHNETSFSSKILSFHRENPFLNFTIRYLTTHPLVNSTLESRLSEAFQAYCHQNNESFINGDHSCHTGTRIHLADPVLFSPLKQSEWTLLYDARDDVDRFDWNRLAKSYAINIYSQDSGIFVPSSASLYAALAAHYCPTTWGMVQNSIGLFQY